jgi:hypothetical protein
MDYLCLSTDHVVYATDQHIILSGYKHMSSFLSELCRASVLIKTVEYMDSYNDEQCVYSI